MIVPCFFLSTLSSSPSPTTTTTTFVSPLRFGDLPYPGRIDGNYDCLGTVNARNLLNARSPEQTTKENNEKIRNNGWDTRYRLRYFLSPSLSLLLSRSLSLSLSLSFIHSFIHYSFFDTYLAVLTPVLMYSSAMSTASEPMEILSAPDRKYSDAISNAVVTVPSALVVSRMPPLSNRRRRRRRRRRGKKLM